MTSEDTSGFSVSENLEDAIHNATVEIGNNPSTETYNSRATLYLIKDDLTGAFDDLTNAISNIQDDRLQSTDHAIAAYEAFTFRGLVHYRLENPECAGNDLREALEIEKKAKMQKPTAYAFLGMVLQSSGNESEAIDSYKQSIMHLRTSRIDTRTWYDWFGAIVAENGLRSLDFDPQKWLEPQGFVWQGPYIDQAQKQLQSKQFAMLKQQLERIYSSQ